MQATRRFVRRASVVLLSTFLVGPVFGDSTGPLLSVSRLFKAKDSYTGPAATKIAEFKEAFVVGGMDFNADGTNLATNAMLDGQDVHVRDWRNSHLIRVLHKEAPAGAGMAIRYSPDGTLLAVGHELENVGDRFRVVRIWDTRTGQIVHDLGDAQRASDTMGFAFTPDGKMFVRTADRVGHSGEYMVVHRTDTWEEVWGLPTLPFIPQTLTLSPDGSFVVLAGSALEGPVERVVSNNKLVIVDLKKRTIVRAIEHIFARGEVQTVAWSPDGRFLAVGTIVGDAAKEDPVALRIFDAETGAQLVDESASNSAFVSGLAFSSDGRFLVEGYIDGKVRIWDGQHKELLQEIPVPDYPHPAISISKDGRFLAIGDYQNVSIWEFKQTPAPH